MPLAMHCFKSAPDEVVENITKYSELMNLPRFGTNDNVAYATAQLNLASAKALHSGKKLTVPNRLLTVIYTQGQPLKPIWVSLEVSMKIRATILPSTPTLSPTLTYLMATTPGTSSSSTLVFLWS